jgi:serine/threonine protein kinase
LYTRLPYTEKDAAYITGKLLSAIKYMHDHAIVHRDLKFENIMFESKSPDAEIKVIDFGLSKKFVSSRLGIMKEGVGTLYSMAPQVLQGVYTSQADMWAVGVITYMLLSSHRPFYSKKRPIMIDKIMRCDYNFTKEYWKPISDEAKDFIDKLLVMDPKVRYKANHSQAHAWMHKEFKIEDRAPTESLTGRVNDILSAYRNNVPLKKLALNVIAKKSTTAEIINLRKAFDVFDKANNGVISSEEFKVALKDKCNYTEEDIKEMFESIDINQNGHIMYTEFIAATLEAQGKIDEDRIAEAFDRLDIDNSGFISKANMMDFLADTGATNEEIENIISGADTEEKDGQVSYEEFLAMFDTEGNVRNSSLLSGFSTFNLASNISLDDAEESKSENLVGVDAVIPGGKYDSS